MHVLVATFGTTALVNTPAIQFHFMRLREERRDDPEVRVMRLFRKIWNRRKFRAAAVDALVFKRARGASAERPGRNEAFPETARRERVFVRGDARGARRNEGGGQGVLHPGARHLRLPIVLAKRVFKAARDLPDTDAEDFGDDGVAVDRRLAGGAVDYATVLAEMRAPSTMRKLAPRAPTLGSRVLAGFRDVFGRRVWKEKKKGVFGGSETRRCSSASSTIKRGEERFVVPGPAQQT